MFKSNKIASLQVIRQWSTNDVTRALNQHGLSDAGDAFARRGVDGDQLLDITEGRLALWKRDFPQPLFRRVLGFVADLNSSPERFLFAAEAEDEAEYANTDDLNTDDAEYLNIDDAEYLNIDDANESGLSPPPALPSRSRSPVPRHEAVKSWLHQPAHQPALPSRPRSPIRQQEAVKTWLHQPPPQPDANSNDHSENDGWDTDFDEEDDDPPPPAVPVQIPSSLHRPSVSAKPAILQRPAMTPRIVNGSSNPPTKADIPLPKPPMKAEFPLPKPPIKAEIPLPKPPTKAEIPLPKPPSNLLAISNMALRQSTVPEYDDDDNEYTSIDEYEDFISDIKNKASLTTTPADEEYLDMEQGKPPAFNAPPKLPFREPTFRQPGFPPPTQGPKFNQPEAPPPVKIPALPSRDRYIPNQNIPKNAPSLPPREYLIPKDNVSRISPTPPKKLSSGSMQPPWKTNVDSNDPPWKTNAGSNEPSRTTSGGSNDPPWKTNVGSNDPPWKTNVGSNDPPWKTNAGSNEPSRKTSGGSNDPPWKKNVGSNEPSRKISAESNEPSWKVSGASNVPSDEEELPDYEPIDDPEKFKTPPPVPSDDYYLQPIMRPNLSEFPSSPSLSPNRRTSDTGSTTSSGSDQMARKLQIALQSRYLSEEKPPTPEVSKTFPSTSASALPTRPLPPTPESKRFSDRPGAIKTLRLAYYFNIDRRRAEEMLKNGKDGYFLLRPSARTEHPLTLTLWYNGRLYNINIRLRADLRYALGSEKAKEQSFTSVEELVTFYRQEELVLYSDGKRSGSTALKSSPPQDPYSPAPFN